MEIVFGVGLIAFGVIFWNQGWWHWLLIGLGVFGVLPWFGAAAILRRGERDPGVFESDPERGRERGRRVVLVLIPVAVIIGGVFGYAGGGWSSALVAGAICGASGALGAWWFMHWSK